MGHGMTPAPTPSHLSDRHARRVDAAVDALVRLLARQAAAEVCAGFGETGEESCHDTEETPDDRD